MKPMIFKRTNHLVNENNNNSNEEAYEMQELGNDSSADKEFDYLMNEEKEPPLKIGANAYHHHHGGKKMSRGWCSSRQLTNEELIVWYLRGIFLLLAGLVGVVIALLVVVAIAAPVIANTEQFGRALRVVDQIYTMKDLTKNMADVTLTSRQNIEKAMTEYDVPGIVHYIKAIVQRGGELANSMTPETLNKATETGSKLVESLQKVDFEQGKQLMQNMNRWSVAIDPVKVSGSIAEANAFLKKTTETLQHAQDTHIMESIQQFAAGGVELEARLKRLNEITLKLP